MNDIEIMQKIYNTYECDWMGDGLKEGKILTKHHIQKKEDGGLDDISNYALLTEESHHLLNFLEDNYVNEYNTLNNGFLLLNRSLTSPSKEYYENVSILLKRVRKQIKNKRRGR